MRNIREVLRLRLGAGLKYRQISHSTKVSLGSIRTLLNRAEELGLSWPLPDELDDAALARLFYPTADVTASKRHVQPDWAVVHQELKRKGVTKLLLWEEYTAAYPNRCYSYSQYCERYRQWLKRQKRSMRQTHRAGEKCFVDYCGQTVAVIDPASGEIRQAQIFVGTLGASNYTFAEATYGQTLPEWLASHSRMLAFFGGCPDMMIPDNLKSGVNKPCRYDPDLNPSYQQWAAHYQVAVLPARPYKPKDKAKAEVAVQIVERWILARLRKLSFFSLAELNRCIRSLLDELNAKPFKQLPGNRLNAFEQLDRPALKPLPSRPYTYIDIKTVKVNIDYHVQYQHHHYSVPHQTVGEQLQLHASETLISLYFQGQAIATHPRKHRPGTTTLAAHMPVRHQKHQQWTPGRLKNWAKDIGAEVLTWVTHQLNSKDHPEQAYRVCLGLLNLSRQYPPERLNGACRLANREHLYRLKQVKSILKANRDQLPEQLDIDIALPQMHENIRGPKDFH
jgi:transposase